MAPSFTGDATPDTSIPARRRTVAPAFDPAGSWRAGVFAREILGAKTSCLISAIRSFPKRKRVARDHLEEFNALDISRVDLFLYRYGTVVVI
jgi:hypothetical protein